VDNSGGLYHVSGHANRPDLERMHDLVRPQMVIPMHGEHRHLRQHAKLAAERGFASAIAPNGTMLDLTGDAPVVAEYVETGRLYLDGSDLRRAGRGGARTHQAGAQRACHGHASARRGRSADGRGLGRLPGSRAKGRSRRPLAEAIEDELSDVIERFDRKILRNDDRLIEALRKAVRTCCLDEIGKKPEVTVVVSRLSE
jgi:ribonuclease J